MLRKNPLLQAGALLRPGVGLPGGVNKDVQFNDGGSFGGTNNFTFDKNTVGVGIGIGSTPGQVDPIAGETPGGTGISVLDVTQVLTNPVIPNNYATTGVFGLGVNPTADNGAAYYANWALVQLLSGNTHSVAQINGMLLEADHFGSGTISQVAGFTSGAFNDSTGTVVNLIGGIVTAQNDGSGPVTNSAGLQVSTGSNSGTITNDYSVHVTTPAVSGPLTHHHAIHVDDQSSASANNPDSWAIFIATAKEKSQLGTYRSGQFTVATLPAGIEGLQAYATNGRKVGEGVGAGTGVPVYFSNGLWRVFSTDAQVLA